MFFKYDISAKDIYINCSFLCRIAWYFPAMALLCSCTMFRTSLCQMKYKVTQERGKAMNQSHIFIKNKLTNTDMTMVMCLQHCVSECRCSSFQICNKVDCELSSTNKVWKPKAIHTRPECDYFELKKEVQQVIKSFLFHQTVLNQVVIIDRFRLACKLPIPSLLRRQLYRLLHEQKRLLQRQNR